MNTVLRNRESGFTLIEVLVVVIIVAILAAIAFPIYQNYVKGAYASDAQSAIGSLWNAAQMYYQDRGEWPGDIEELQPKYINLKTATTNQWEFEIQGSSDGISIISATSTEEMRQGEGHTVTFYTDDGRFSGYGFEEEEF